MFSKSDDYRAEALECLERAGRIQDKEAQLILLQELARRWWRMTEMKKLLVSKSPKSLRVAKKGSTRLNVSDPTIA